MPLKKDILSFIKTKDYDGLEYELKNLKTNQKFLNESLKWACFEGDAKSIEILIKYGANANYTDEFGTTSLHFAVKGGRQDVVVTLLNHGARYADWEIDGLNLVQWCVRHGFDQVIDIMVKRFNLDLRKPDDMGRTCLHSACMYGQVNVVEYILETGLLSVDERDENGWTPLHYACSEAGSNFRKMIQVLFKYNADPILLTTNNKTSLDLAYESGRAQQLIDVLTVHKMLQLLISVDSVIVGKIISQDNMTNLRKSSDIDNMERQVTMKRQKPFSSITKLSDRHTMLKLSIWRKVLLNDDVEILQEYRDSGIWYDFQNPVSFEQCQELTKQNFAEIFKDSYENGVGLFSYFNDNFRKEINKLDFAKILISICGLTNFPCLAADDCILFGSFHESILFLGLITGRFKVVEVLLKMRQFDIIPVCLMICLITRHLHNIKNFPLQIIDNLRSLSFKSETIAVDVLNRVYFKDNSPDKQVTLQLINMQLSSYGSMSLIDLADLANCSNFLSLPCCQLILDRRWYGNLRPLRSHLKWVIRFIPVSILFYNPYKKTMVEPNIEHKKSIKSRFADIKMITRDKVKSRKKVSELEEYEHQESYLSSSSRYYVLRAVVNAPGTKFFYHSTAHFIFLIIMSYTMLFKYDRKFAPIEVLCYFFVLGYGIEEVRQCFLVSMRCSILEYLKDKLNWLDISAISTTILGISLKIIEQNTVQTHEGEYKEVMSNLLYVSRVTLLFALMLFYLRILFIVSISAILGPKLRMIGDMLRKDFLPLLLLFVIFILAFGVLFQGILYPNGWYFSNFANETIHRKVEDASYKILGLLLKRAIYGIFEADFPIEETKCDESQYCIHPIGKTIFLSFSLILYIVIVNIMLMNLLIALFSNTVARIDQRSMEHWLAGRYKLVEEYKERSICPPPFNIIERVFTLIFFILRYISCSECINSLSCSFKVVNLPESEINIVVKFIIIQSFALKTCRYILGTKNNRDILTAPSSAEKKMEMEIKSIKLKLDRFNIRLDKILALIDTEMQTNMEKSSGDTIIRTFSHFKYNDVLKGQSKRNSKISNSSSYKQRDRDQSMVEEKTEKWNNAMDSLINILDKNDDC